MVDIKLKPPWSYSLFHCSGFERDSNFESGLFLNHQFRFGPRENHLDLKKNLSLPSIVPAQNTDSDGSAINDVTAIEEGLKDIHFDDSIKALLPKKAKRGGGSENLPKIM